MSRYVIAAPNEAQRAAATALAKSGRDGAVCVHAHSAAEAHGLLSGPSDYLIWVDGTPGANADEVRRIAAENSLMDGHLSIVPGLCAIRFATRNLSSRLAA